MSKGVSTLKIVDPAKADKPTARKTRVTASGKSAAKSGSTQRIVDSVTTAIAERRLMPGTKLSEQKMGDIYNVSRTVVRQAFNQLSRDRLVVLEPARGAFVAMPTVAEARHVFAVRDILEAAVIRQLCPVITDPQIKELRYHLQIERSAVSDNEVSGRTRLLADFHIVLAQMLGNQVLVEMLSELLIRSSLIALMYQSSHSAEASLSEHVAIVDALEKRDVKDALRLMGKHLDNVLINLHLDPHSLDLAQILKA
ncbi:GntR family transcriptional regulator [Actimicrobium antarcticum]|uniref:GntR family transcriptional regulator n=1 Tax=Actimicrobium antarcticum TaxID=1051899 RepID=A0ABP7TIS9_9BURK